MKRTEAWFESIAQVAISEPSSIEKNAAAMIGVPTSGRPKPFDVAMMSIAFANANVNTSTSATPWMVRPW